MSEPYRLVLMSDVLLERLIETQALADDCDYAIAWGQPRTEVVTYYEPVVTRTPKVPPIETQDDG